ncbi:cytochrome [Actinosynnema sp. ALI-1.44]|nr:cytochrome [Actinosynnema sp. ALI-1.44]
MPVTQPLSYPFNRWEGLEVDERYARLRAESPMVRVKLAYGNEAWLATRYEDGRLVLADPRFSRVLPPGLDMPRMGERKVDSGLMATDPPEHSRIRRLAAKAFTQRGVESLRPTVTKVANELVDAMIDLGPAVDLVANFAVPLPTTTICVLLGVPVADQALFGEWASGFLSATGLTAEKIDEYQRNLWTYMAELLAERVADPQDDLLSALANAKDNDDRFSGEEVLHLAASLLAAGHETTTAAISDFVLTLLRHPGELAKIEQDPELIPQAVEELMRFVPLGVGATLPRYAKEDVEVGGVLVRAGEPVLVTINSVNRDDAVFPNAATLDVTRTVKAHLGFGHGVHHCLGASLARTQLQVALATLVGRLPNLRLAVPADQLRWKQGGFVRSPAEMPISWDPPVVQNLPRSTHP